MQVVRTSHIGLSSHPPNHLVFYYYLADNRDRCLTNNTTDNDQRPGPPVHRCLPCRPVKARGYRQGEPSPYLVSRVLLEELDFRGFGNSRGQRSGAKHTGTQVVPSLSSRRNTSRGHRWVARLLTFKDTSWFESLPLSETRRNHPRWYTWAGSTETSAE